MANTIPTNTISISFAISKTLSAFDAQTVGSKVVDPDGFMACLRDAMATYDFSGDKVPGQSCVIMPESAFSTVSAGVGKRLQGVENYTLAEHRGVVGAFLKREHAAPVESLKVIVYARDAYNSDPDVKREGKQVKRFDCTHVIVAVLAGAGEYSPYTPKRFTANLAGGNKEAALWSADEIRAKAVDVNRIDDAWCVVAD